MDVLEAIRTERAVRHFADTPLPDDVVRSILNAGRRAQSSKNTQPWHFVAIRDRNTLKQLSECGTYAGHLAGAAFAVALVSSERWGFDLGQAAAYMQLAAWDLGIGSCIAAMWEPEKAGKILGIPSDLRFDLAISFGYPAEDVSRPPTKGGRQSLEDVVHWERW